MRVGSEGADASLANACSLCTSFALKRDEAAREIRHVIEVVDKWRTHFDACGVTKGDIEQLAEQIDRPFLHDQRWDF